MKINSHALFYLALLWTSAFTTYAAQQTSAGSKDLFSTNAADSVRFSHTAGYYPEPFSLQLTAGPGATIRYTLDGNEPDSTDPIYLVPISMHQTCVLRARAFWAGLAPGPIATHTFILPPWSDLPSISLTTAPRHLWDPDSGIYVLGRSYQSASPNYGANFWEEWERPVHIELFEPQTGLVLKQDAGVMIHGGWSRARPQKSLALFARKIYGAGKFKYPLFPRLPFDRYDACILRNAANDWDRTFFADGLIHSLVEDLDLEKQAYRPCAVYLNGGYWGILNMREKINEDYLAQHHPGVDPDQVDELEMQYSVLEGDSQHYRALLQYLGTHDMRLNASFQYVQTQMEVENFITYQAVQIYVDNRDWPGNNIKFWRPHTADGRWRWILYDTEWGFGINAYGAGRNANGYDYNTLAYATSPSQTANHHGNPPWSTLLLRTLLQNDEFKRLFINRFADLMHSVFKEDRVQSRIDSLHNTISREMPRHYEKWRQPVWWCADHLWWSSLDQWEQYVQIMRDFGRYRPTYMRSHIMKKFGLTQACSLLVQCDPPQSGRITFNQFLTKEQFPFTGIYFANIPITVSAQAKPGFRFIGWQGATTTGDATTVINLNQAATLTACFAPEATSLPLVVINEINYSSSADFDPEDWIELYNAGATAVDLSAWRLTDEDPAHLFTFPSPTELNAHQYLVVCRDAAKFANAFANPGMYKTGNLTFGLSSSGDQVKLYDAAGLLLDSVAFSSQSPWPTEPKGKGATLALYSPEQDNSLAQNWFASPNHGSPGAINRDQTGIGQPPIHNPGLLTLQQNYPNPFNAQTTIRFCLPGDGVLRVSVYDIRGQRVRTLRRETAAAGEQVVCWDGCNEQGIAVSSGIYLYELLYGRERLVRRLLVLR